MMLYQTTFLILLCLSAIVVADNEGKHTVRRRNRMVYGLREEDGALDSHEAQEPESGGFVELDNERDEWNRALDSTDMSMDCVKKSKKSKKSKKYVFPGVN
jgi:hypothetical protein